MIERSNTKKYLLLFLFIVTLCISGCKSNIKHVSQSTSNNVHVTSELPTHKAIINKINTHATPMPSSTQTADDFNRTTTKKHINPKSIPILYYHNVSDKIFGIPELFVSPVEFEKQMNLLKKNNYNVITFAELANIENITNPVIITFDDGYENNYVEAYPILKKYNYRATIFITTNFINCPNMLKDKQMKEMIDLINFQSHTLSHPNLTRISYDEAECELSESKKVIEKITNSTVDVLAYPVGYYNSDILKIARKYYKYAVLNIGGHYTLGHNNYQIKRVYIPRNLDIMSFERKIKG